MANPKIKYIETIQDIKKSLGKKVVISLFDEKSRNLTYCNFTIGDVTNSNNLVERQSHGFMMFAGDDYHSLAKDMLMDLNENPFPIIESYEGGTYVIPYFPSEPSMKYIDLLFCGWSDSKSISDANYHIIEEKYFDGYIKKIQPSKLVYSNDIENQNRFAADPRFNLIYTFIKVLDQKDVEHLSMFIHMHIPRRMFIQNRVGTNKLVKWRNP